MYLWDGPWSDGHPPVVLRIQMKGFRGLPCLPLDLADLSGRPDRPALVCQYPGFLVDLEDPSDPQRPAVPRCLLDPPDLSGLSNQVDPEDQPDQQFPEGRLSLLDPLTLDLLSDLVNQ